MRRKTRNVLWFSGGIASGVALGWLTAPRRGDWVRNQLRQKMEHWRHRGRLRLLKRGRDLENRFWGSLAAVRQAWTGREHYVDANTLVDQVHTELGRRFGPTLAHVNLNAFGHTVYLHGYVDSPAERDRLIAAIAAVDGVDAVAAKHLRLRPAAPAPAPPPSEHAIPPRRRARRA
jgi:hypothetical protein